MQYCPGCCTLGILTTTKNKASKIFRAKAAHKMWVKLTIELQIKLLKSWKQWIEMENEVFKFTFQCMLGTSSADTKWQISCGAWQKESLIIDGVHHWIIKVESEETFADDNN